MIALDSASASKSPLSAAASSSAAPVPLQRPSRAFHCSSAENTTPDHALPARLNPPRYIQDAPNHPPALESHSAQDTHQSQRAARARFRKLHIRIPRPDNLIDLRNRPRPKRHRRDRRRPTRSINMLQFQLMRPSPAPDHSAHISRAVSPPQSSSLPQPAPGTASMMSDDGYDAFPPGEATTPPNPAA